MKVLFALGTRPEAIKLAPVIKKAQEYKEVKSIVCSSGQHDNLLTQMLAVFSLKPDYDFSLMKKDQDLIEFSSRALLCFKEVYEKESPDVVVVQGDTTTALMAALAASYKKIRIAHVEAGLRSHDFHNPFPEEINRTLIGGIADFHFVPTERAKENLYKEGITKNVYITGNTVVDALLQISHNLEQEEKQSFWLGEFKKKHNIDLKNILQKDSLVLLTTHRRESFGKDLEAICEAVKQLIKSEKNLHFIFPVHPNPNVREPVLNILGDCEKVSLLDPLDYEAFLFLLSKASLVMTDSGGVQEEAPSFKVPVVIMRNVTERQELVDAGLGILAGTGTEKIVASAQALLNSSKETFTHNPFGDGEASARIIDVICSSKTNVI